MYCKHCGAQNIDGSAFCANCGQSLADAPVGQQQPAQTIIIQQTVDKSGKPVEPPEPAPTGLKKVLYLVGSICSFVALVLLFGLFLGSGLAIDAGPFGKQNALTTIDVFKPEGLWKVIIDGLKSGKNGIASVIGDLFTMIMILAGLITLIVYLIIGIVKFVKAMKGTDYRGVTKTAIKAYCTFATIELLSMSFHASNGFVFNDVALAAFCLCAILIGANFVLHLVGNLKENLGLKKLLGLVFTVCLVVVGVIVAALAAGPVINYSGEKSNFFQEFINAAIMSAPNKIAILTILGWFSSFILVVFGVSLIQQMFLNIANHVDGRKSKKSGAGLLITSFIFALLLVVVTYLYGKECDATVNGALPIVIMVFSLVGTVLAFVKKKVFDK